jgi:hypothetical protein
VDGPISSRIHGTIWLFAIGIRKRPLRHVTMQQRQLRRFTIASTRWAPMER